MQYILFFALFLLTACNGGSSKPVGGSGADPADDGSSDTGRTSMSPEDVLARLGGAGKGSPSGSDAGMGYDAGMGEGEPDSSIVAGSGGGGTAGSDMGGSGGTGGSGGMGGMAGSGSGSGGTGGGDPDAGPAWMPSHDQFLGDWSYKMDVVAWDLCDGVDPGTAVYDCTPSLTCPGQITVDDETTMDYRAWTIFGTFDHWDAEVWVGTGGFSQPPEDIKAWYYPEVRFWLHDADTMYGVSRPPADIAAMYPSSRRCQVYKLTRL